MIREKAISDAWNPCKGMELRQGREVGNIYSRVGRYTSFASRICTGADGRRD